LEERNDKGKLNIITFNTKDI